MITLTLLIAPVVFLLAIAASYILHNTTDCFDINDHYVFHDTSPPMIDQDLVIDSFEIKGCEVYADTERGRVCCGSISSIHIELGQVTLIFEFFTDKQGSAIREDWDRGLYKPVIRYQYHPSGRCAKSIDYLYLESQKG